MINVVRRVVTGVSRASLVTSLLVVATTTAAADPIRFTSDPPIITAPPKNGTIEGETVSAKAPKVRIGLTDDKKKDIGASDWPQDAVIKEIPRYHDLLGDLKPPPAGMKAWGYSLENIPQVIGIGPDSTPVEVKDVSIEISFDDKKLGRLEVESTSQNLATGEYLLDNIFGAMADRGGSVHVPVLFGDTNADGVVGGDDDLLYSLVDLRFYPLASPLFAFGSSFLAMNGVIPQLPGMLFSTTAFSFDPVTGFQGTPYTGAAGFGGDANLTAVPEPGTLILLAAGLMRLVRQRRSKAAARSSTRLQVHSVRCAEC